MRKVLAVGLALVFLAASTSYADDPSEVIEVFEAGVPAPAGLAITPDGDLLVVSKGNTSQIFKIDVENGQNMGFRRFAHHRGLCNSRYIAIDSNGYAYVDTSRPTTITQSRPGVYVGKQTHWVGMFQISPDGKTVTRIEGIDDDTLGLAVDPEGNLYACTSEVPMDQHDQFSKFAEKSAERMFTSSDAIKPRIIKFKLGDNSNLDNRSDIIDNMDVSPAGMTFNSEGDLFFTDGGTVLKVHFGILGPSRPKAFATLPTAKAKATRPLGISVDKDDNLYVSVANPYGIASGTIFKVDPKGKVTTLATGLINPTDCVTDAEGNIYFADPNAEKVFQIPAEAAHLEGPFKVKKPPPPPVAPPVEPVAAEKEKPKAVPPVEPVATEEPTIRAKQPASPAVEPDTGMAEKEYRELSENLAAIEKELDEKRPLMYPDTIVLKGGREMKCEIVSDAEDAVYANMDTGSASIPRRRIELVIYATGAEKEQALQAKSEIEELERQRNQVRTRMRELRPPTRQTQHPAVNDESGNEKQELEEEE